MKHMLAQVTVTAILPLAGPAFADAGESPVLQRIQERGVVSIGQRET